VSRGVVGALERSWSGAEGSVPWTWALYPLGLVYGAGAAIARARAARTRRGITGLRVIAVGGLTAGGSGKSSVAQWLASELHARGTAPAILLRGHRAPRPPRGAYVVPDYEGYPRLAASERGGDEAAAHRSALAAGICVATGRDRYGSARLARTGYGAGVAILDDGWEQGSLRWDELWAVIDPRRPLGNGAPIPAGPLRRPASTLRDAAVVATILDAEDDVPGPRWLDRIRTWAPGSEIVRFRRVLASVSPLGERPERTASSAEHGIDPAAKLPPAGLVSGVGAPERLEGFARASGIRIVAHAAFPDHAAWSRCDVEGAAAEAVRKGAGVVLTTEKDEARWPGDASLPVPVLVLRTSLLPLDPVEAALARARGAMAPRAAIG
jgi:tetraacyldisaccharide 4'-kinase